MIDPLRLGDTPDDYIEEEDGSVTIPDLAAVPTSDGDFFQNLAETLEEKELETLSRRLLEAVEKDKDARKKRDEQQADGLRRSGLGDDAPGGATFDGASRVVHPVLAEATIDFAASAMKELFPPTGPVKAETFDNHDERIERAERKRDFMNWQLTTQMPEYRDELEQLLTQLPMGGSQFQKFWYDERLKRPVSEFVPIDAVLLPSAASNFYTAHRATHVLPLTKYEFDRRVKSGLYRDVPIGDSDDIEKTTSALANEKIEGKDGEAYDEDGLRVVYEIYVFEELDDPLAEDETAPYIVTIDAFSEKIVAVYRNWEESDALRERLDWFVEWKFIPWRGAYAVGLPHLIGGLSGALTGALRAILDSAHIQNAPTMLKLKGGRVSGQNTSVELTQIHEIDAPGVTDIRNVMMPMPFPGPSPVLFQLLGFLENSAKGVVSTAEEKISDASNQMPVGTAMALIEQGSKVFSSIHARGHNSQKKALAILNRINKQFPPDPAAVQAKGGPKVLPDDFDGALDVIPVSDPNIFSEAQRFAQMQAVQQLRQTSPNLPWNDPAIVHRLLRLMHVDRPEDLLPKPPDSVSGDPVLENAGAVKGSPIKVSPKQDHMAHIQAHVQFILDPVQGTFLSYQGGQALLQNITEHIGEIYKQTAESMKQMVVQQALANGQQMSDEAVSAMASQQAQALLVHQFGADQPPPQPPGPPQGGPPGMPQGGPPPGPPQQGMAPPGMPQGGPPQGMMPQQPPMPPPPPTIMQLIQQAQQAVQKKAPPPQMPPEVQASMQIAQMENQRRTQSDQASMQMKQAEIQATGQLKQAEMQMKQAEMQAKLQQEQAKFQLAQQEQQLQMMMERSRQQFEQQLARLELQSAQQKEMMAQQTEIAKNDADNRQKQMTELLKNTEDNQTAIIIAKLKEELSAYAQPQGDLSPMVDQMSQMLKQIHEAKTNDALGTVVQGLQATIESINRPKTKMFINDERGRPIGLTEE